MHEKEPPRTLHTGLSSIKKLADHEECCMSPFWINCTLMFVLVLYEYVQQAHVTDDDEQINFNRIIVYTKKIV